MNWSKRMKDVVGGVLVLLIGIGAMVQGQTYNVGTLNRMGPGYFPVALGAILAGIGGVMLVAAYLSQSGEIAERKPSQLRGWLCIVLGVAAFPVIGKYGGHLLGLLGLEAWNELVSQGMAYRLGVGLGQLSGIGESS